MTTDLSLLHLITGASPIVQLVMLLLFGVSLVSWAIIFSKRRIVKNATAEADGFEQRFWSGADLGELYKELGGKEQLTGMETIFTAGFREYARLHKRAHNDPRFVVEGSRRAMRIALSREQDQLELHLSFLATVGSTSPYIGLFGTVWGIMNSFRALGNVNQATISLVAPGIAEALVATAMGLFAAIPAVIAYNRYADDIERLINRYEMFLEEFLSILLRQAQINESRASA